MSSIRSRSNVLRDALLALPPSGANGFEGLLATVFAKLLGVPFRLAKSGSQFGVDGKTSDITFPVAFEAKRYSDNVPSTEVLNKIGALAIHNDPVELWILGTTGVVSSQVADDLNALATRHGIATLILDWHPDAPRLAAVLTAARAEVAECLNRNVPIEGLAAKAIIELERLAARTDLADVVSSVLRQLDAASVATPMAHAANRRWLLDTLSNRIKAKGRLGQVLTPLGATGGQVLSRGNLVDKLQSALQCGPEERLVALLGDEGNGKSWLTTKACFDLPTAKLLVVFSPEEFGVIPEGVDWDELLAKKLLVQTEESVSQGPVARWRRRFERWRNAGIPSSPRLLILVDGLNQRPLTNWGRHIDSLVLHAHEMGARVIVTSRSEYFRRDVEPRLLVSVDSIIVPRWTPSERDQLLAEKGVANDRLQPAVADSLLNPRLLGIALTLLNANTLESLDALTVPWLLFEHLRMLDRERSDGHSAAAFASMLQDHAKDILSRVRARVSDDLTSFDNLEPAAEGRFFQWIEGEPTRYTLCEQGLTYALGLAVIEELRAAVRNGRDVQEALNTVLEPIAALDRTADAAFAALTFACLDEQVSQQIAVALLAGFAHLQNPDSALAPSMTGLAARRVHVFCETCEALWMAPQPAPNADWLEASLHAIKLRTDAWKDLQLFLNKWLCYWWPDIRVDYKGRGAHGSSLEAAVAERNQQLNSLNEVERGYLSQLIEKKASPHRLIELALQLCAGMPLESLAGSLACTSFSMALTPVPFSPYDDLRSLISFNRCDWSATRDQLMTHVARLTSPGTSASGQWAAVTLLRSTGAFADSAEAHELVLELTKDHARIATWRQVEAYCATDPCDPESERPDNIDDTASTYAQTDVSMLRLHMGMTEHDYFFDSALPGLARFLPNLAVRKHREFLAALPNRRGLPLRQATWTALDDAALVDDKLAARFLRLSTTLAHDHADVDQESVAHVQQALLLAAFPRLSPEDQFAGMDAVPDPNHIWVELLNRAKDGALSQLIHVARKRGPSDLRVALPLALASRVVDQPLPGLATMLPKLLGSQHSFVRSAALHLATVTGDPEALRIVVESGWKSSMVSRNMRERITGSMALIEAVKRGLADVREISLRIAPETLGVACARLNDASVAELASVLDACVRAAAGFSAPHPPVEMVRTVTRTEDEANSWISLNQVRRPQETIADHLGDFSDDQSRFHARRKQLHHAYETFESRLTPQTAAVVLNAFNLDEIRAVSRVAPQVVHSWARLLRDATASGRRSLRNFGIYVACALTYSEKSPEGFELLARLQEDSSFVQVRYTLGGLSLESVATWWCADCAEANRLRFSRLDACGNDRELALETAAAIYAGKAEILKVYVRQRLESLLPIDVARAIAVVGFSDDARYANELAASFKGDEGLLATAARSCRYAMERHQWSKHWFRKMLTADSEEQFWTASVLFLKVVDARFDAEHRDEPAGTEVFNTWWWSVERRLGRRYERWANKREKTLFGSKVPDSIYLPSRVSSHPPPTACALLEAGMPATGD